MDNEEKYLEIREKLKNLQQVKASDDFVQKLHHKIVELEADKKQEHKKKFDESRGGFLKNLFINRQNPWLIPAVGFTVLIFFVFYIVYLNKYASENNKDLLTTKKTEQTEQKDLSQQNQSTEKAPSVITEKENEVGKENSSKKDIVIDLKTESNNKIPSTIEKEKKMSEKDVTKKRDEELSVTESSKIKREEDDKVVPENNLKDKKELNKKVDSENETGKDIESSKVQSIAPRDSMSKKLIDKLNAIDKTTLENLRERISNN